MANSRVTDWLKSWPLALLPHHALSRLVRSATRWRVRWWKNLLIQLFIRHFRVDMSDAVHAEADAYPHFNSFFTRALRDGVRPQPDTPAAIACPVDGAISELGAISGDRLLQAKGRHYSLIDLLGGNREQADAFRDGLFCTLYLSPRDYHRIHMPVDGSLRETTYIPGRLFSVAPHTTRAISGLFTRNERLVTVFDSEAGPVAVILVGAIFVACTETVWGGVAQPTGRGIEARRFGPDSDTAVSLRRGEELGRFNMGSTVILLFPPGRAQWLPELQAGQAVRLGQTLGYLGSG
jgi:phosphatidylserine decarboxylase